MNGCCGCQLDNQLMYHLLLLSLCAYIYIIYSAKGIYMNMCVQISKQETNCVGTPATICTRAANQLFNSQIHQTFEHPSFRGQVCFALTFDINVCVIMKITENEKNLPERRQQTHLVDSNEIESLKMEGKINKFAIFYMNTLLFLIIIYLNK